MFQSRKFKLCNQDCLLMGLLTGKALRELEGSSPQEVSSGGLGSIGVGRGEEEQGWG